MLANAEKLVTAAGCSVIRADDIDYLACQRPIDGLRECDRTELQETSF